MGGDLSPLSEQQLVDCDTVDSGCNGGLMDNGFAFAEKSAMCTEDSYSYTARKGTCKASSCTVGLAQGRVNRQRAGSDVGSGTATRVHRHRGGPVLVSII